MSPKKEPVEVIDLCGFFTSTSTNSKKRKPPPPTDANGVIDLCDSSSSDDDDEPLSSSTTTSTTTTTTSRRVTKSPATTTDGGQIKRRKSDDENNSTKVKSEPSGSGANRRGAADDDEVMVVVREREIVPAAAAASAATASATGDEVELVGTVNELRLPHARHNCLEKPFQSDEGYSLKMRKTVNKQFCDCCYCYVCDVKASECENWDEHCLATDKKPHWRTLRQARKQGTASAAAAAAAASGSLSARMMAHLEAARAAARAQMEAARAQASRANTGSSSLLTGSSPYRPDCPRAQSCDILTKCRHCGWFNKFVHRNFEFIRAVESGRRFTNRKPMFSKNEINPTGYRDWCHACGRVASERDLGKVQSSEFDTDFSKAAVAVSNIVLLGTKTVSFRLRTHDPRQMQRFKSRWQENEGSSGWIYDDKAMEEELFLHRFGERPSMEMIFQSISNFREDSIPTVGSFSNTSWGDRNAVSVSETEALLVDDKDRRLLLDLYNVAPSFGSSSVGTFSSPVAGDVRAEWCNETRKGTFTIRTYLTSANMDKLTKRAALMQFLGSWYELFPFKLTDLAGHIRAEYATDAFRDKASKEANFEELRETMIDSYNEAVDSRENSLTLQQGSGTLSSLGGVCTNETNFEGVLKRFYREILPDVLHAKSSRQSGAKDFILSEKCNSRHRSVRKSQHHIVHAHSEHGSHSEAYQTNGVLRSFLTPEDFASATTDLVAPTRKLMDGTKKFQGLMDHLNDLGHASAPHFEGLTVELLPFQKQSLQWALERETTPGGIQAFLWPKLPSVEQPGTDVWFNPIIGKWTSQKPNLVRGGIIAEQMGLGKTVISLAMILCNPAPALPASGSAASHVPSNPDINSGNPFWDPDMNERLHGSTNAPAGATANTRTKRGSILCRGTLVVCNVSLVGQWVEEAKSKLSDPGLIYSYHGQSRKRDPNILARNAIVVTTYETLASDATYHKQKSKDQDYCPPCEQIRWWRIICDESHNLRSRSGKSIAAMDLVGDHRWLVSGTPVGTTLMDLKNQFQFIGLQNIADMFNVFQQTVFVNCGDPQARQIKKGRSGRRHSYYSLQDQQRAPWIGHFSFLMRSVMVRHTQNMKYRGTETTLMSLPPKVERTVVVKFNDADKAEYEALEQEAREFYQNFKKKNHRNVSKCYLKLTQKLTPLRTACAGGRIPLDDDGDGKNKNGDEDDEDEQEASGKKRKKKVQKFSEYSYTSKLDKLIEELESIKNDDPTSKTLVFSQYTSTLKWLQEELPKRGFQYRTLSGDMPMKQRAKALADFQHDPPTTIFLLSIRAGACGINLTQANRVFLLDPMLNPAIEAQAIGRVHRLGQERNVEITRLVMENSIETRMVEMLKKKYGDNDESGAAASNGDTGNNDEETADKEKAKDAPAVASIQVGSLNQDKNSLLTEEFDLLFDWSEEKDEGSDEENQKQAANYRSNGTEDDSSTDSDDDGNNDAFAVI